MCYKRSRRKTQCERQEWWRYPDRKDVEKVSSKNLPEEGWCRKQRQKLKHKDRSLWMRVSFFSSEGVALPGMHSESQALEGGVSCMQRSAPERSSMWHHEKLAEVRSCRDPFSPSFLFGWLSKSAGLQYRLSKAPSMRMDLHKRQHTGTCRNFGRSTGGQVCELSFCVRQWRHMAQLVRFTSGFIVKSRYEPSTALGIFWRGWSKPAVGLVLLLACRSKHRDLAGERETKLEIGLPRRASDTSSSGQVRVKQQ